MRNCLLFSLLFLLLSCVKSASFEKELKGYYFKKINAPLSFELVEIKEEKLIYYKDEIEENLECSFSHLKTFNDLVDKAPSNRNYKKSQQRYLKEIEDCRGRIDSIEKGLIENSIKRIYIRFLYKEKNEFDALVLKSAIAKIIYNSMNDEENKYSGIYAIEELN